MQMKVTWNEGQRKLGHQGNLTWGTIFAHIDSSSFLFKDTAKLGPTLISAYGTHESILYL